MNDNKLELKRYNILKPYFSKEINLKELSDDTQISYSTLKRWASKYRKNGLEGLKKTKRIDSSTYRALSEKALSFIKRLYDDKPDMKILEYHQETKSFLKDIGEKTVSYDTVYRVIKTLDPYTRDASEDYFAENPNEIIELESFTLDYHFLDERDNLLKKPYAYIIYDNFSQIITNFHLSFDKLSLSEILCLLRDNTLKFSETNYFNLPKEFRLNNMKISDKNLIEDVKNIYNLDIFYINNKEFKFLNFINKFQKNYLRDLLIQSNSNLPLHELERIFKDYIDNRGHKISSIPNIYENSLSKIEKISDMDLLLPVYSSKRKVKDMSIRFQNVLYHSPVLFRYEDYDVEIRYNPLNLSRIKAYVDNKFLCDLKSDIIEDYPISLYTFEAIKNKLKNKIGNNLGFKGYLEEFKNLVKENFK